MPTWIKSPPKQLIFSALSILTSAALALNRFATEHYGWAAMWFVIAVIHVCIVWGELLQLFKKRGM